MTLAYGALALAIVLAVTVGALLSRWYVTPTAKRLAVPQVNDWGWCPEERTYRLHRYDRDDSRTCWTCETRTPGGAR
ncbi:hypothetical protein [Streptomyces griseoviridis]|uniref:Uncharacterized protein n=1 Tax=Streptomyces griseoviridis TaxID=45398 RepID=A0ABT9LGM1_STRGD|nr:hypothetical protein [Streptomyces griseoviridis]MDP9682400.1 hypothetical protein [Streptomyces griseoviridis]GGS81744.1 hypothetical protein GCM10010240_13870 [Streptomyces griseoviridis]